MRCNNDLELANTHSFATLHKVLRRCGPGAVDSISNDALALQSTEVEEELERQGLARVWHFPDR
jgi:hypothetical protein